MTKTVVIAFTNQLDFFVGMGDDSYLRVSSRVWFYVVLVNPLVLQPLYITVSIDILELPWLS